MKRALNTPARSFFASVAIALLVRCGSLNEQPLAGGAGAGNPGGTVTLSMRSGVESPTTKHPPGGFRHAGITDSANPITVTDSAGLAIVISSVSLTNIAVLFSLDSSEAPSPLLSSMKHHSPELSTDTHCIMLSGSYLFNALEGNVDPSIRALRLPVARYTGVGLHFNRDFSQKLRGQIVMNGTFLYNGISRKLIVDINNPLWSAYRQSYRFSGGIFTLSQTDTTNLRLQFNAKIWFSGIDIAYRIKKGDLSFNKATGALHITNRGPPCVTQHVANSVFEHFVGSGKLVVY